MSEEKVQQLLKRHDRAMEKTAQWRDLLDTTYFYALPNRNPFNNTTSRGNMQNEQVYDNTLVLALRKFVNRMIKALLPPEVDWLKLIPGREIPEEDREEKERELQAITETFFFYLRQSNFDLVIHEAFMDMAISTGVIQINEGGEDDPLMFSSVPSDKIGFESDQMGDLSAFFRTWPDVPVDQAQAIWNDNLKIPAEAIENKEDPKLCIKEISYYDFKEKVYRYYVIDAHTRTIMLEEEMTSWPWIGFRWSRYPGEDRGRGPALDAVPTAATINKAIEDELKSAALAANPPYMAYTDSIINPYNFKVEPNAIISVNPGGTETWPIAPLPGGGDISFSALVVNDLRAQINEIMMAQPLNPLQNGPVRTATEVAVTQNELRENAGAAFSRVQRELFDPLVKRVIYILKKKGLMAPVTIDGREVAISYSTPLSVSKDTTDVQTFVEFYQILAGMFTPGIAINLLDAPKLPRWIGSKLNTQLDLIKDSDQVEALIQQALQMAEGAAEQQQPGPQEPGATDVF